MRYGYGIAVGNAFGARPSLAIIVIDRIRPECVGNRNRCCGNDRPSVRRPSLPASVQYLGRFRIPFSDRISLYHGWIEQH